MIVLFSVFLYPLFFIASYIIAEYIFPTRNSAMLASFLTAFVLSYAYYTVRSRIRQQKQQKENTANEKKELAARIMLISKSEFESFFPKNCLCDNSFNGLNEETLLEFLRTAPKEPIEIYSLNGLNSGSRDLLALLGIKFILHTQDDIILHIDKEVLPQAKIPGKRKLSALLKALTSPAFGKFALKYGVILAAISFFTPYKVYYLITGISLALYSAVLFIMQKISQQSQTQGLRT